MTTADERAGEPGRPEPAAGGWPVQVADQIESAVDLVRDRAVRPLRSGTRIVVYGLFAALMVIVVVALAVIAVVRVFDVYVFPGRMWATDAVAGGIFVVAGAFLWLMRRARK